MIFGKNVSDYLRFQRVFLGLILVLGLARLGMSLAGLPNDVVRWSSMTAVAFAGWLYYSIAVHTSGFGSYKQLLPLLFFQSVLANLIIIPGIVISIVTGQDNIFSAPEFSPGGNGRTWLHVLGHVIVGFVLAPLVLWLVGSVILAITKKAAPRAAAA